MSNRLVFRKTTSTGLSVARIDRGHPSVRARIAYAVFCIATCLMLNADRTHAQAYPGYTLYSGMESRNSYLVNMNNQVVHSWSHTTSGGYSCYLLSDGSLLRPATSGSSQLNVGGSAGKVQRIDWNGSMLWDYTYSSSTYRTHHDIEPMPNGNVLLIAWEVKNSTQCVAAGLDHSASLWPDHVIEVQPTGSTGGNIVWQWHAWDHLIQDYNPAKSNYGVVAQHPELLDINCQSTSGDWLHLNAISYNPDLDQIVLSSHFLNEIYVIDHSTTTAEAATHAGGNSGKGGDIPYRWGSASNYRVPSSATVFDVVHGAWWVPTGLPGAGNILAFNNRQHTGTSMIVEITPPTSGYTYTLTPNQAYGPTAPTWTYTASGFFSDHLGGNQRLPNGNTLIAQATSGKLFEVNTSGVVQWTFTPGGQIPRCLRYDPTYPGLAQLPVELTAFRGLRSGSSVQLWWSVSHQSNNYGFQVQRSFDGGISWDQAGFVPGHGTSNSALEYSFSDPITEQHRDIPSVKYRLRQLDTDGSSSFSPVVDISMGSTPATAQLLEAYPNPVRPGTTSGMQATIEYFVHTEAPVSIKVYNGVGLECATLTEQLQTPGYYSVHWDASNAAPGVYYCRLAAGAHTDTKKLIVAGFGR
jgi:hypothetical protein